MVISALWRCFSTVRMTFVSNLSPSILRIFVRPSSTSLRMVGVTSQCLPVYSTFTRATSLPLSNQNLYHRGHRGAQVELSFLYSALMGTGDAHVFPILGYGAASDLNALRLQNAGELLVGQWTIGIFFLDQLFDASFQDQQRSVAAL